MDIIKAAFTKIKEDIYYLRKEILELKDQLKGIQTIQTQNILKYYQNSDRQTDKPTVKNPTEAATQHIDSISLQSSIGNKGVPTDRQTNQQTDRQPQNTPKYPLKDPISEFKKATEILESLDSVKKEIRAQFRRLTSQEMLVFSKLYELEQQNTPEITYKILSVKLNLSESSIRDYINKLIKKGIPIDKIRLNNKTILLKVSQDLKNVATLSTIIGLRDL